MPQNLVAFVFHMSSQKTFSETLEQLRPLRLRRLIRRYNILIYSQFSWKSNRRPNRDAAEVAN